MTKYKAIIFDLDGTLLDTSYDLADAVNHTLSKNGFPKISTQAAVSFTGNGMKKLIERSLGQPVTEEVFDKVFTDFTEYYSLHSNDNTKPYVGIPELISKLKEANIPLAVLSNKKHAPTTELIRLHFPDSFSLVYGEGGEVTRKPETKGFWKILKELGINEPKEVLYIGDSEVDVMTVKNALCDGIFVSWGFRTKDQLIDAGAEIILDSTNEVLEYINKK